MGTPLTGSSVASTYTGLLKVGDNSTLTTTLKSLSDGSGVDSSLQVSTTGVKSTGTMDVTGATSLSTLATSGAATIGGALNVTGATTLTGNLSVPGTLSSTGDFAVNTNKFNVTASSGNTAVAGTLGVTGATSLSTLATSGAATLASLGVTGAATVGTTLGVTGAATVGTTLGVTGVSTLASAVITGAATVGTTLGVTGAATLSDNLTVNGNTTIGNAGADLLTINANEVTLPNLTIVPVDLTNDKVLITDASDSSKVKAVAASSLGLTAKCVQTIDTTRQIYAGSATAPGQEITVLNTSITPTSVSSKILVTVVINYSANTNGSQFILFRLTRDSTELGTSTGANTKGISSGSYEDGDSPTISNKTIQFLDSPNTTSAVAYKLFNYGPTSQQNLYLNYAINDLTVSTSSSMTLQEYLA